jgi:hypothetical protein
LAELRALSGGEYGDGHPFRTIRVVPDDVALPPIWLLGSSGASARLAGELGMGYSFASHFSPSPAAPPFHAYRESFQPSEQFPEPHAILAVSVVCAKTDEQADWLARSMDLAWVRLVRGEFGRLPSPEEATAYPYTAQEQAVVRARRAIQFIGSPATVRAGISVLKQTDQTGISGAGCSFQPEASMSNGQNERTILVTGATGHHGGAVARHLLRNGFSVRALTRSPDKPAAGALRDQGSEVVEGDLDDRASLEKALQGAYGVFSVQNFWETGYQREIDQGIRLADAAKDAGVQHFVYSWKCASQLGAGAL